MFNCIGVSSRSLSKMHSNAFFVSLKFIVAEFYFCRKHINKFYYPSLPFNETNTVCDYKCKFSDHTSLRLI